MITDSNNEEGRLELSTNIIDQDLSDVNETAILGDKANESNADPFSSNNTFLEPKRGHHIFKSQGHIDKLLIPGKGNSDSISRESSMLGKMNQNFKKRGTKVDNIKLNKVDFLIPSNNNGEQ